MVRIANPARHGRSRRTTAVIDDPVRLYLAQMGGMPLLTREGEVGHARQIEHWRRRFRRTLLANDFVLAGAVALLEKVQAGTVRLDRTIEVSVTNTREKRRILRRLAPNLATLRRLQEEKARLFRTALSRSVPVERRREAWRRLVRQRNKAVRLVEEMHLRIQRLYPLLKELRERAGRLDALEARAEVTGATRGNCGRWRSSSGGSCSPRGRAAARSPGGWRCSGSCSVATTPPSATSPRATCGW